MSLTVDTVTRVAREAARAISPALQVVGITLGGGASSDYVEILVNVSGSGHSPSQIEVGAFRDVEESALHMEIAGKLRDHIAAHPPTA